EEQAREFFDDEQRIVSTGVPLLDKMERRTTLEGEAWSCVSKVPVSDKSGRRIGVLGISRDISALKRAEQEAQRSQAFLNSVIEHLPIMVFIKRAADLRYILWNRASEELTGKALPDVVGRTDYNLFSQEEADRSVACDREALAGGKLVE